MCLEYVLGLCAGIIVMSFLFRTSPPVGTLKRRRAQAASSQTQPQRAHHRQPRENYQMGQMRRWAPHSASVLPSAYHGKHFTPKSYWTNHLTPSTDRKNWVKEQQTSNELLSKAAMQSSHCRKSRRGDERITALCSYEDILLFSPFLFLGVPF